VKRFVPNWCRARVSSRRMRLKAEVATGKVVENGWTVSPGPAERLFGAACAMAALVKAGHIGGNRSRTCCQTTTGRVDIPKVPAS